jgi:tRNA (guanine10-N2)-dimethyltransferase
VTSKIFLILSGEHSTLPKAEVKAIFEAEKFPRKIVEEHQRLIVYEGKEEWAKIIGERSGMCKASGIEIFESPLDLKEISKNMQESNFEAFIKPKETFAVRIVNLTYENIERLKLERFLGSLILKKVDNVKVDLENPSKTVLGVLTKEKLYLGIEKYKKVKGDIASRSPKERPVSHAATMKPKLARCMVNLSRASPGKLFLDPFCGVGGLLIEAGLIGCKMIGCDVKLSMVKGAFKNLLFFGLTPEGLIQADARKLPLNSVSCIATDPPYGTSTTTLKSSVKQLLQDFLIEALRILEFKSFICLAAPKEIQVEEIGEKIGFNLIEKHEVYIHKKLTREIIVFKKNFK